MTLFIVGSLIALVGFVIGYAIGSASGEREGEAKRNRDIGFKD